MLPFTFTEPEAKATWPWLALVGGSTGAIAGLVWSSRARWRAPPDWTGSVAQSFRSLMFIRLGLAASPALYGVAGAELARRPSITFVGTAVSLVLLASFGPTRSRVDDVQRRIRERGSPILLRATLNETP